MKDARERERELLDDILRPMNLQLFAEDGGDDGQGADEGGQGGDGGGADAGQDKGGKGTEGEKKFTQAELDDIISRRFAKLSKDFESRLEEARKDGEKRAKMSEDERAKADREAREEKLRKREAEITRRELRADAIEKLVGEGLPRELADLLDYSDADKCESSLDNLKKVFRASVQAQVDARIRESGGAPGGQGGRKNDPDPSKMSDAEYYAALKKK